MNTFVTPFHAAIKQKISFHHFENWNELLEPWGGTGFFFTFQNSIPMSSAPKYLQSREFIAKFHCKSIINLVYNSWLSRLKNILAF